jgi:hypothetical protein
MPVIITPDNVKIKIETDNSVSNRISPLFHIDIDVQQYKELRAIVGMLIVIHLQEMSKHSDIPKKVEVCLGKFELLETSSSLFLLHQLPGYHMLMQDLFRLR